MIPNCKKNELKIITNLYQIIPKLEYTTETTFLQIISKMPDKSLLIFSMSDVTYTNEVYEITKNKYVSVEIFKYNNSGVNIKIYDRNNVNNTYGFWYAESYPSTNYISPFTFIGKSGWNLLTPANGWQNYANSDEDYHPYIKWRRENDRIYLRGLVKRTAETTPSSSTIIAKVPTGFFPKYTTLNSQVINYNKNNTSIETSVRVDISNNGEIIMDPNNGQNFTIVGWLSLDNVSWGIGEK